MHLTISILSPLYQRKLEELQQNIYCKELGWKSVQRSTRTHFHQVHQTFSLPHCHALPCIALFWGISSHWRWTEWTDRSWTNPCHPAPSAPRSVTACSHAGAIVLPRGYSPSRYTVAICYLGDMLHNKKLSLTHDFTTLIHLVFSIWIPMWVDKVGARET